MSVVIVFLVDKRFISDFKIFTQLVQLEIIEIYFNVNTIMVTTPPSVL